MNTPRDKTVGEMTPREIEEFNIEIEKGLAAMFGGVSATAQKRKRREAWAAARRKPGNVVVPFPPDEAEKPQSDDEQGTLF